jgi:signal transduction histidine kinase
MQQVLLNLYSNAIKFTQKKGKITIIVEKTTEEVNNQKRVEKLIVTVKDTGIGIKEENQGNLFKMFGSIKDEKNKVNMKGIGLGLVISKMIVE